MTEEITTAKDNVQYNTTSVIRLDRLDSGDVTYDLYAVHQYMFLRLDNIMNT
jgi:hypothetical protein